MAKTNLGRVVGLSAFEEWKTKNPEGTWEQFMESLKGPGVLGFEFKEELENGNYLYDVILEGNIKSGTIIVPCGKKGSGIIDKEFIRKDAEGNYIYRDIYTNGTKSSEYISPRGPRGYTGGTVGGEEPGPPTGIYGEIKEFAGNVVPEGWALCNGGILSGKKYPHLIGVLDCISEPTEATYKFIDKGTVGVGGTNGGYPYKNREVICQNEAFISNYYTQNYSYIYSLNSGLFFSEHTCKYISGSYEKIAIYATTTDASNKYRIGWIGDLELKDKTKYFYPKAIAIDGKNLEYGGLLGGGAYNQNLHPDIYFNLEYIDEYGDWRFGIQLHNKTDFVKSVVLDNMYIATISTTFKTNKIRLSIDPKSLCHYPTGNLFFIGRFHTYLDDLPNRNMTVIKLPDVKDSNGKYKLVYIGLPLEIHQGIYSYSKDNIFNGEVPLSLAVNNKLPNYIEGITMAEPQPLRMGYINKYHKNTDTWELIKTHEKKEGYYYDKNEDLRYTPKPSICHIFDFNSHTWVFSQEEKEKALKSILEALTLKKLEKETMIELNLNIVKIDEEIINLKKEIEEVKKING